MFSDNIELFKQFLRDKELKEKFDAAISHGRYEVEQFYKAVDDGDVDLCDIISQAFPWNQTDEGREFWKDVHYDFEQFVIEYKATGLVT